MNIGIDIDDTIASTNEKLIETAIRYDKEVLGGRGFKNKDAYKFVEMFYWDKTNVNNFFTYVRKSNFSDYNLKYIGFSNISQKQNLVIGTSILGTPLENNSSEFIAAQVSNNIDTGLMIYQENGNLFVPNLQLFFNGGIVLSLNTTINNNDFAYIDNTGTIQNGTFEKPVISSDDTSYDISYYTNYVSSFIDDLSASSLAISIYTQEFYNSLPLFFQTFIFVIFILACIYFVYFLIKR